MYSGYGITFNSAGTWDFDNDIARNFIIYSVDNSSSYHADNCKNNFLVLVERVNFGINGRFGSPEKIFYITFSKTNTKLCLSLHYMLIIVICLLMENKSISLKAIINILIF